MIHLNLEISCKSSIDLSCSFSALRNSFLEIFCLLAIFFLVLFLIISTSTLYFATTIASIKGIYELFSRHFLRFWNTSVFCNKIIFFLVSIINFGVLLILYKDKNNYIFLKKLITLIIKIYMHWLCLLFCTLIYNFRCK